MKGFRHATKHKVKVGVCMYVLYYNYVMLFTPLVACGQQRFTISEVNQLIDVS